MKKLKIGFIGLGQRGAAYGMTDGSIGLLGNVLKNSDDVIVTVICDKFQERLKAASAKIVAHGYPVPMQTTDYKDVMNTRYFNRRYSACYLFQTVYCRHSVRGFACGVYRGVYQTQEVRRNQGKNRA